MAVQSNARIVSLFRLAPAAASALAISIGLLVLLGWIFNIPPLKSVLPGLPVMVVNTAVAFILSGISLWLSQHGRSRRWPRRFVRLCGFSVFLLSLLTITQYAFGWTLGVDQLFFHHHSDGSFPGRMSPHTTLSFLLMGAGIMLLDVETRDGHRPSQFLALAAMLIPLLALVGYTYGVTYLYGLTSQNGMALHTALTAAVLSAGLFVSYPDRGLMTVITSDLAGGVAARRLLVAAVGIPLWLAWLTVMGQRMGLYNAPFGSSVLVVASVVAFVALIWQSATSLDQSDAARKKIEEARGQLLNRLVTAQEAERRRIARELHDQIGQILTGLKLILETSAHLPPERITGKLREALELVNELMSEVRELSLDLRPSMLDDLGLLPVLVWHFERYGKQTGITVNFEHRGLERRFGQEVETAAYRIVQEALTNVARHARVPEARVHVWASDAILCVQVEDSGIGFDSQTPDRPYYSSGLIGMYERAVSLNGQLRIESKPNCGTRLIAELPSKPSSAGCEDETNNISSRG